MIKKLTFMAVILSSTANASHCLKKKKVLTCEFWGEIADYSYLMSIGAIDSANLVIDHSYGGCKFVYDGRKIKFVGDDEALSKADTWVKVKKIVIGKKFRYIHYSNIRNCK